MVSAPIGVNVAPQNPYLFGGGTGLRPCGNVYSRGSSSAVDALSVDGTATAGDVITILIGTGPGATTTNSYTYTVLSTDTLANVRDGIVKAINSAPDPNVIASSANEFQRILISARVPGPAGEGITLSQAVNSTATESITIFNPITCWRCRHSGGEVVTTDNPAVPGELVYVFATGLGPRIRLTRRAVRYSSAGNSIPLQCLSTDSGRGVFGYPQLVSCPGAGGSRQEFELSSAQPTDTATQLTIAQQAFVSNVVTFAVGPEPANLVTATGAARHPGGDSGGKGARGGKRATGRQ